MLVFGGYWNSFFLKVLGDSRGLSEVLGVS